MSPSEMGIAGAALALGATGLRLAQMVISKGKHNGNRVMEATLIRIEEGLSETNKGRIEAVQKILESQQKLADTLRDGIEFQRQNLELLKSMRDESREHHREVLTRLTKKSN